MGYTKIDFENLYRAAQISCIDGSTMHNMPFTVNPDDVVAALLAADQLGHKFLEGKDQLRF
jgi:glycerol dehydrogenase